jgi:hypothetical protein
MRAKRTARRISAKYLLHVCFPKAELLEEIMVLTEPIGG